LCTFFPVQKINDLKINVMAEIHVEAKKHHSSPVWIWILIGIIIAAIVIYFVTARNKSSQTNTQNQTNSTSAVELPQQFNNTNYVMTALA
jgi:flagellar basal body-associated protein FliL